MCCAAVGHLQHTGVYRNPNRGCRRDKLVEQDDRGVKRVTQPMLEFKSFWSARILIGGIETMHMNRKGQMNRPAGSTVSAADQLYSLAWNRG